MIAFNETHPEERLNIMDQEVLKMSQDDVVSAQVYQDLLALQNLLSRQQGIDVIMTQHNFDALMAPAFGPVYKNDRIYGDSFSRNPASPITPAAQAGYPSMTVPLGDVFGLAIGMAFVWRAFSEPTLIRVASGSEAVIGARKPPKFLPSIEETAAEMLMASRGKRETSKETYAREVKKRAEAGRRAP